MLPCCVGSELSYYCVSAWFVNMLLTTALLPLLSTRSFLPQTQATVPSILGAMEGTQWAWNP